MDEVRDAMAETPAPPEEAVSNFGPRASQKAIMDRLPVEDRKELEKEIVSASEVTVTWLDQLDEKFGLWRKYAVTRSGLRGLVYRLQARHGKEANSLKDRQKWVNALLKQVLGAKGKNNPRLLGQRVYLAMVAVLYDRLVTHGKDISTEELAALSKMLAEQRRAEAQSSRGSGGREEQGVEGEGELPENFGETVKQLYGTNFQAPSENVV